MGILVGFVFICLLVYAILVTNGLFLLLKWFLISLLGLSLSTKILWIAINVVLCSMSTRFLYAIFADSKGGTPNMEVVWKFFLCLNAFLFLVVFLFGYKSK